MDYNSHQFSKCELSVLNQESNWFWRGVVEAVHFTRINPDLKRDKGRHYLSPIYQEVLQFCDTTPLLVSRDLAAEQQP